MIFLLPRTLVALHRLFDQLELVDLLMVLIFYRPFSLLAPFRLEPILKVAIGIESISFNLGKFLYGPG